VLRACRLDETPPQPLTTTTTAAAATATTTATTAAKSTPRTFSTWSKTVLGIPTWLRRLARLFLVLVGCAHTLACLWSFVGDLEALRALQVSTQAGRQAGTNRQAGRHK